MKTFYDLLNLRENADKRDIKRAFHRLAKKCHPDVSKSGEHFIEVLTAYETLIDDRKREAYNRFLSKEKHLAQDLSARGKDSGTQRQSRAETLRQGGGGTRGEGLSPAAPALRVLPRNRVSFALSLKDVTRLALFNRQRRTETRHRTFRNPAGYHVAVRLSEREKEQGSAVYVDAPAHVVCPVCGGDRTGCRHCGGKGYILKAVPVLVTIPPHCEDGEIFSVPLRSQKRKQYAFFMIDKLFVKIELKQE